MKTILALVTKEFIVLYRDKWGLFGVFLFPLLIAVFLGFIPYPQTGAPAKISLIVIDEDQSPLSRFYLENLQKNPSLVIESRSSALPAPEDGEKNFYCRLILKKGFGQKEGMAWGEKPWIEKEIMNPEIEGTYLNQTLSIVFLKFLQQHASLPESSFSFQEPKIIESASHRYEQKPRSAFEISFPLAVLWSIMSSTGLFTFAIVIERTNGTLLRLRLALKSMTKLLMAKAIACLGLLISTSLLFLSIGYFIFHVRIHHLFYLSLAVVSTSIGFIGIMMFISVLGKTEQIVSTWSQAILLTMMTIGGGVIPLVFMPHALQIISNISPVKWGILSLEGAMWRQFTLMEMLTPCTILVVIGIVSFFIGAFILIKFEDS